MKTDSNSAEIVEDDDEERVRHEKCVKIGNEEAARSAKWCRASIVGNMTLDNKISFASDDAVSCV